MRQPGSWYVARIKTGASACAVLENVSSRFNSGPPGLSSRCFSRLSRPSIRGPAAYFILTSLITGKKGYGSCQGTGKNKLPC